MDLGLKEKVALVTGGSAGIGRAIARQPRLKATGSPSARDEELLEAAAKQLSEGSEQVLPVPAASRHRTTSRPSSRRSGPSGAV